MSPSKWRLWQLNAEDHVADHDIKLASMTAQMTFIKKMFTEDFWTRIVSLSERTKQVSLRNRRERDDYILWDSTDIHKGAKELAIIIWQDCNASASAVIQVYEWHTHFIVQAYAHKWTVHSCDSLT